MKTQIKYFTVNLLNELINNSKDFINLTNGNLDMNPISRYDNGIPQELLYATEDTDGNVIIFDNNIINTLIYEMQHTLDIRRKRLICMLQVSICIAKIRTDEDAKVFKHLVIKL